MLLQLAIPRQKVYNGVYEVTQNYVIVVPIIGFVQCDMCTPDYFVALPTNPISDDEAVSVDRAIVRPEQNLLIVEWEYAGEYYSAPLNLMSVKQVNDYPAI